MATYYTVITGSRILNASRVDQSGSDDTAVTNWAIGDDFILAVHMDDNDKNAEAGTYKLQWKKGAGGSFTDLANTGELNWNGTTSLENGTACSYSAGDWRCDDKVGDFSQIDGTEREGSNDTVAFDGSDADETEHQWAINCDGATAGETYYFQTVDTSNGDRVDAIGVTISMAAANEEITPDAGAHGHDAGEALMTLQNHSIAPDPANHGHDAGEAYVNTIFKVTPDTASHSHAAGVAAVDTTFKVEPADGTHAHAAGEPGMIVDAGNEEISPDTGTHLHAAGEALVNTIFKIEPANGIHAHAAGTAAVDTIFKIVPTNGVHTHAAGTACSSQRARL